MPDRDLKRRNTYLKVRVDRFGRRAETSSNIFFVREENVENRMNFARPSEIDKVANLQWALLTIWKGLQGFWVPKWENLLLVKEI